MPELSEKEMLEKLRGFNTPSITNIVATYPKNPLCLGLYEPWRQKWYTDQSVRCLFPELPARIGYAVTVVFTLPNPNYQRWSLIDLFEILLHRFRLETLHRLPQRIANSHAHPASQKFFLQITHNP